MYHRILCVTALFLNVSLGGCSEEVEIVEQSGSTQTKETSKDVKKSSDLATPEQIAAFRKKLKMYREATIKALEENQKNLDKANKQIEAMLDQAYVLNDGRRVFKTKDGKRIIDEFGKIVAIHSNKVSDNNQPWESYYSEKLQQIELAKTNKVLVEFKKRQ